MAWDRKPISLKEYQKRAEALSKRIQDEVEPFEDVSLQAKEARKKRAKEDLLYFCTTYLPHHFEDDFEQGHEKMAASTKVKNKVVAWLLFRGAGKSTFAEVGYGAHCVLFRKTRFLPILSDTDTQAVDLMLPLKVELEENPRIKSDFGEMKGLQWAEDEFITSNDVKVEAFSWRSFKRGRKHKQFRFNVAIGDDWEDSETAKNPNNSKRRYEALINNVVGAAANRKGQEWQVIMCLNRIERTDLSHRLEENKEVHFVKVPAEDAKGRSNHPKAFPKSILNRFKKLDPVAYAKNYLLKIISKEDDDFQEEWFVMLEKPEDSYKYKIMINDPSVGSTSGHDTKPWLVMGLTHDEKHIDVLHAWIRNTTIDKMCHMGFKLYPMFQPHKTGVEGNGFQVLLKPVMQAMANTFGYGFSFMQSLVMMNNRDNKNVRILRLQPGIQNGFFRFVKGSDMHRLIHQFLNFDSSKSDNEDDGPDAMEMGNRLLKKLNGEIEQVNAEVYY